MLLWQIISKFSFGACADCLLSWRWNFAASTRTKFSPKFAQIPDELHSSRLSQECLHFSFLLILRLLLEMKSPIGMGLKFHKKARGRREIRIKGWNVEYRIAWKHTTRKRNYCKYDASWSWLFSCYFIDETASDKKPRSVLPNYYGFTLYHGSTSNLRCIDWLTGNGKVKRKKLILHASLDHPMGTLKSSRPACFTNLKRFSSKHYEWRRFQNPFGLIHTVFCSLKLPLV